MVNLPNLRYAFCKYLRSLLLNYLTKKEYRKRNASGAVYDDPRVAVAVGRFDEVAALAEA